MHRRRFTHKLLIASAVSFAAWMIFACSDTPLGAPVGDQNFDDPNDPGQTGQNNFTPEAGDAMGKFCVAARDCPAAFVCAYPIADACSASGRCLPYTPVAGCANNLACACLGTNTTLCAPDGYALVPVAFVGACDGGGAVDGAADATSEAASDASTASDAKGKKD